MSKVFEMKLVVVKAAPPRKPQLPDVKGWSAAQSLPCVSVYAGPPELTRCVKGVAVLVTVEVGVAVSVLVAVAVAVDVAVAGDVLVGV